MDDPTTYPIIAKCKSCGNPLGSFSGEEKAETTVKCTKCGTMNSLKLRAIDEEARIKAEKLYPRRV